MKIKYHTALDWSDEQIKIMNSFGVFPKKGHTAVEIDEDIYVKIKHLIMKWRGSGGVRFPDFSIEEQQESLLSARSGGYEHGYPMPAGNGGFRELTYDLSDYCDICGVGKKQKNAFRIKSEPSGDKKKIFSLGWIFDELFVQKNLYEEIFMPLGIGCRPVLKYKTDAVFENTVQLVLPQTNEKLDLEDVPHSRCKNCDRVKYEAMPIGFYPAYKEIVAPIFKSSEDFGSGALAFKRIFVTKELREKLFSLGNEKMNWYIPTR